MLLGIAIHVYGVAGWYRSKQLRYLLVLMLGGVGVMFIRVWLAGVLVVPLVSILFQGRRNIGTTFIFVLLTFAALWLSVYQFVDYFKLQTVEDLVEKTDTLSVYSSQGGSKLANAGFSNIGEMVVFIPLGVFTALFRPLPGDVLNPFGLLASFENVVLLILLLQAINRTHWYELREPMLMWAVILVLTWATVYGYISAQNLGLAVRYRLQILPVLLGLLLYLVRRRPRLLLRPVL